VSIVCYGELPGERREPIERARFYALIIRGGGGGADEIVPPRQELTTMEESRARPRFRLF
jgi:hypothetical protein